MSVQTQLGGIPVQGGDVSFKNYSGSDIAAGKAVIFDTTSGNIDGIAAIGTAATVELTCGITLETIYAGKMGRVRVTGAAVMTSNDTITAGQAVQIDSASGHEGQCKLLVSGKTQLGRAMTAAAAGDTILVWVNVASTVYSA